MTAVAAEGTHLWIDTDAEFAELVAELAATDRPLVDELSLAEIIAENTADVELAAVDVKPPPKMAWCLIGIPVVRYGEISAQLERIGGLPGIIMETCSNDG